MRHASIEDAVAVRRLLDRCLAADSRPALSEFKELRVPVANAIRSLVGTGEHGEIDILAVAAWHPVDVGEDDGYWAAEIVVSPEARTVDAFRRALTELSQDLGAQPSFWAFTKDQETAAKEHGLEEVRAILEMRRDLPGPIAELRDGFSTRSFEPGDEGLWLALNQQVFGHHPEAGAIDGADLALRMAQPWFDPDGLLILEHEREPVGYCWTKMHDATVGEIYMIGLVPDHRGMGLAKPLTLAGLTHLAASGAAQAILYAEAANGAAVSLYEGMNFETVRRLALYAEGPT